MDVINLLPVSSQDDRISKLTDDILHWILSLLSMKEKAQTSILSRRWQHLWLSNPTLEFEDYDIDDLQSDDIATVIDQCLHASTVKLQTLTINLRWTDLDDPTSVAILDGWIRRANERSISELALFFSDSPCCRYEEPLASVFRCGSLRLLVLACCDLRLPACHPPSFSNLADLSLKDVKVIDSTLSSLLRSCTLLKNLVLSGLCGTNHIEISHHNSQLEQLAVADLPSGCCVVIKDAPSLYSITYRGDLSKLFMKKVPKLTEAKLACDFETPYRWAYDWMDILPEHSRIEILTLNVHFFSISSNVKPHYLMMPRVMKRIDLIHVQTSLKELHLCECSLVLSTLDRVLHGLQHLSSLERLCVRLAPCERFFSGERKEDVHSPPYEALCSNGMKCIKAFTVAEFSVGYHEKQLVNAVLRTAERLEVLNLNLKQGTLIAEKRRKELLQTPRVSRNAQVVLSEVHSDESFSCPRQSDFWVDL